MRQGRNHKQARVTPYDRSDYRLPDLLEGGNEVRREGNRQQLGRRREWRQCSGAWPWTFAQGPISIGQARSGG
jgi:hypothetical protein